MGKFPRSDALHRPAYSPANSQRPSYAELAIPNRISWRLKNIDLSGFADYGMRLFAPCVSSTSPEYSTTDYYNSNYEIPTPLDYLTAALHDIKYIDSCGGDYPVLPERAGSYGGFTPTFPSQFTPYSGLANNCDSGSERPKGLVALYGGYPYWEGDGYYTHVGGGRYYFHFLITFNQISRYLNSYLGGYEYWRSSMFVQEGSTQFGNLQIDLSGYSQVKSFRCGTIGQTLVEGVELTARIMADTIDHTLVIPGTLEITDADSHFGPAGTVYTTTIPVCGTDHISTSTVTHSGDYYDCSSDPGGFGVDLSEELDSETYLRVTFSLSYIQTEGWVVTAYDIMGGGNTLLELSRLRRVTDQHIQRTVFTIKTVSRNTKIGLKTDYAPPTSPEITTINTCVGSETFNGGYNWQAMTPDAEIAACLPMSGIPMTISKAVP